MGAKQTYTCEHCGCKFVTYYEARHKFCCRACQKAATAKRNECVCKQCGTTFVKKPASDGLFCSYACYWKSQQGKKPHNYNPVTIECAQCGMMFDVNKYRIGTVKFCSYECAGKAKSEAKPKVPRTCIVCGKRFEIWPSQASIREARYCSHECHGKDNRGERCSSWKGGRFPYYGGDWKVQRKLARKRDGYRCQVCGVSERKLPYRLHVHHIIPRREFNGDLDSANALSNLICLCRSCHRKAETGKISFQPKLV